jgi:hypothetical protein
MRLTNTPQMRSMSSSLMLWSSAMGSGQSGSGCQNASAKDAFDERATFERWEIHRCGANRSLSRGGEASSLIMDIRIGIP